MKKLQPYTTEYFEPAECDQLYDDILNEFEYIMTEKYGLTYDEFKTLEAKFTFSLSNCQGDGICFDRLVIDREILEKLFPEYKELPDDWYFDISTYRTSHHYSHSNTYYFTVEISTDEDSDNPELDIYKIQDEELPEKLKEFFDDILHELEKYGYEQIDFYQKDSDFIQCFNKFKELNNIESDLEAYEFEQSTKKKDGFTLIGEDFHTMYYLKLPEIQENERVEKYLIFKNN